MPYIEHQEILSATNGGLDIITYYYPQAVKAIETTRKEFKIRPEKTPSARLKQLNDGNWVVTDFGDDSTPRNGIQICMKEEGLTYREAIVILATRYGIGGIKAEINKPGFEKRDAKPEEAEGEYYFDVKTEITDKELLVLGPKVTREICKKYNYYSLNSFTQIKDRKALVTSSNENYPIFIKDEGTWKKIYQPLNPEKQYRFRYTGEKEKDFINGLKQVIAAFNKLQNDENIDNEKEEDRSKKLTEVVLCSGDRDALNVAGLGYQVIWLNSETSALTKKQYDEIMKYTDVLYNLPDIDDTGKKQAIKLGMQYLDIKTIWLPDKLKTYKDHRGNPRKDLRDYIEIYHKNEDFRKLLKVAMPLKFWDEEITDRGIRYHFNNSHAYFFLVSNGFYRIENKNVKGGKQLIKITDNIVKEIEADEAKGYINNFLTARYLPIQLRNVVYKTNQLSDGSLSNLPDIKIDFTDYGKHFQFLFFENKTWEITAEGIQEHKPGEINKYVWEEEVIQHKVKKIDSPFKITYNDETREYDIDILNTDSLFFQYLINASRIHWHVELTSRMGDKTPEEIKEYKGKYHFSINGPNLTDEEILEQKHHLINKIFSLGYLLHRYKDPARPWCVWAMDNRISETGKSYGRSGKSVCYKAPRYFMKSIMLPGRNPKLTDNAHIYDRVTEHTDYILVDDANQYLNFDFFFEPLTGPLVVNPKNNQSYEIPFEDVGKFAFTTNFALRNIDPSTEGRILYTVFSDYYHIKTDDSEYADDRTIRDDIGKNLFYDYDENDWNQDINFFAYCLSFFLGVPSPRKINPPLDNVTKRNLLTEMTEAFREWADVYFSENSGNIDRLISKSDATKNFMEKTNQKKWTTQRFTKSLKAWARYTDWIIALDPEQFRNSQGRIIRKFNGEATEMIYVQTKNELDPHSLTEDDNEIPFPVPDHHKPF